MKFYENRSYFRKNYQVISKVYSDYLASRERVPKRP